MAIFTDRQMPYKSACWVNLEGDLVLCGIIWPWKGLTWNYLLGDITTKEGQVFLTILALPT